MSTVKNNGSKNETTTQPPPQTKPPLRKPKRRISGDNDFIEPLLKTLPSIVEKRLHFAAFELVIVTGVIFLLFHFLYIRHFPELDFASSMGLLALVAITGIFLIAFVALILLGPVNLWLSFVETEAGKRIVAALRNDSQEAERENVDETSFENGKTHAESKSDSIRYLKLSALFVVPISITMLFSIAVFFALIWTNYFTAELTVALVLLSLALIIPSGWLTYRYLSSKPDFPKLKWYEVLIYLGLLSLSFLLFFPTPALIYALSVSKYNLQSFPQQSNFNLAVTIFAASLLALTMNAAILTRTIRNDRASYFKKASNHVVGALLLLFILVAVSSSWFSFPQAVLRMYGLADVYNLTIAFDQEGCAMLRQIGVRHYFDAKDNRCTIAHATALSKIGSAYYLETEDGKRISVPKNTARIAEDHPLAVSIKLEEVVDDNDNLQELKVLFGNMGNRNLKEISIYLVFVNQEGSIVEKRLLKKNESYEAQTGGFTEQISVPVGKGFVWSDAVIIYNGKARSYNFERTRTIK